MNDNFNGEVKEGEGDSQKGGIIMTKIKPKEIIEKIVTSPIFISFIAFVIAMIIVVMFTISKVESGYDSKFIRDILVESHGMLLDILVIGTFIFALHTLMERRREKIRENKRYQEEIDDFRIWESEEAKFRIVGNIRRLNRNDITAIDLSQCYLKSVKLYSVVLQGALLYRTNLEGAYLRDTDLRGAYIEKANLRRADLQQANLSRADLTGASLQDADLREADLREAHLGEADLREADLREAHLEEADLSEADLQEADLSESYLCGTSLGGANLDRACLDGANLERAYLIGVVNLTIEQLCEVKTLYNAELDPELRKLINEKCAQLLEKPK